MIIIGSYAALLGRFYPTWRDAPPRDIDINVRASEIAVLDALFEFPAKQVSENKWYNLQPVRPLEITVYDDEVMDWFESMAEESEVELDLGITVRAHLGTLEVVWAARWGTAGGRIDQYDKSMKDLAHYDALVQERGSLKPEHLELAEFYRRNMLDGVLKRLREENAA